MILNCRVLVDIPFCKSLILFRLKVRVRICLWSIRSKLLFLKGGAVAQSVERATPGQEVPGSIPAVAAHSLLVGSVSV